MRISILSLSHQLSPGHDLSVPDLIEFASRFYTLHPGDVIFTGTPDGVGPVKASDVMHRASTALAN